MSSSGRVLLWGNAAIWTWPSLDAIFKGMAKLNKHADPDDDTTAFLKAVKEGVASLDAGRTVPYDDVRQWLLSWGTEKELPKPKCR